ncbi:MAG: isoprenylcysteine carboxylmethyltransferase family protein [bacterium]
MKKLRELLFQFRSYTPIPFIIIMLVFAHPTIVTMVAGLILVLFGEFLRSWGVSYAGSLTRVTASVGAPEVIVSGPYAHMRNPLYSGNIFMYVGVGIMANAIVPWLVIGSFVYFSFQYVMIVQLEEAFLEKEFGEGYSEYKKQVPRFFPRLTAYRHSSQERQHANWIEAFHSERRTLQALGIVIVMLIVLWYAKG